MRILIDPGHGGYDPGAVSQVHEEEDINLEICQRMAVSLGNKGYLVQLTRDTDVYISPRSRWRMINLMQPDCFVSVHCNSASNPKATGMEVIYRDVNDLPLANRVMKALEDHVPLPSRGIKSDELDLKRTLAVLGHWPTPSCLVEVGFLSNPVDSAIITDYALIAEAIVKGVERWVDEVYASGGRIV